MRRTLAALVLGLTPLVAAAATAVDPMPVKVDLGDKPALQRGAQLYVNFCLGCHSLDYVRYNRIAQDLRIPEDLVREHLAFTTDNVVDNLGIAMRPEAAAEWFGIPPPDLSVISRARGADWLYTYLTTFYRDPSPTRPFAVNNLMFQDVGMPHAMWSLQGIQEYRQGERPDGVREIHPVRVAAAGDAIRLYQRAVTEDGRSHSIVDTLEVVRPGTMQPGEFRRAMRDLTAFLVYVGEPAQLVRYRMGIWVLAFLLLFTGLAWLLYKEYWKDVH
jgi:ubiquinol-cytochrome c reductase cytochrome c1 subunit